MIKFDKHLYLGESLKEPKKVIRKLKKGEKQWNIYVLAVSSVTGCLEIYNSLYLQQRYYKKNPPRIIGIANGYEEAQGLLVQIVEACLAQTGNCHLKEYLIKR